MPSHDYPRLSIEEFGAQLLLSGDLDPVYIALNKMEMPEDKLARWLVAYSFLYDPGAACWLSEQEEQFFKYLRKAAENETPAPIGGRWRRAPERRHWRGAAAISCVDWLIHRYARPEDMVNNLVRMQDDQDCLPYSVVAERVKVHPTCGDWIAYKWADLLERCYGTPILFQVQDAMYDSPRSAALSLWRARAGVSSEARIKDEAAAVSQVLDYLFNEFKSYEAPGGGRTFSYQEAETCLCKYQSHLSGHYPINNDLIEIQKHVEPWQSVSKTAQEFNYFFPRIQ